MPRSTDLYRLAEQQGQLWDPKVSKQKLLGLYVCSPGNTNVDSSNRFEYIRDLSGNGNHLTNDTNATNRPNFRGPTGPYIIPQMYESGLNGKYLDTMTSVACGGVTVVCDYDDGNSATFNSFTYVISSSAGGFGKPRFLGDNNHNRIRNEQFNSPFWLNGELLGTATILKPAVLPLPPSVMTVAADLGQQTPIGVWEVFGSNKYSDRSWWGAMPAIALYAADAIGSTDDLRAKRFREVVEAYLSYKSFGNVDNLHPTHTFKSRPPLIADGL